MSAGSLSDIPQVRRVLQNCRRQIVQHTVLVGIATLLSAVLSCMLLAGFLDYAIGLPGWVRATLLAILATLTVVVSWRFLIRPLKHAIPADQLGAAVDLSCPDLNESLSTLISIQNPEATSAETGSQVMRSHLENQVTDVLRQHGIGQVVDGHRLTKRCVVAAIVILMAVLPLLFWPTSSRLVLQRMMNPFANLATVSNLYFEVADGNRTVARGSNVTISATPLWRTSTPGERPQLVQLELIAASGDTESMEMAFDEIEACYTVELSRIAGSVNFRVKGGGSSTEIFTINVVDAPEIRGAVMTTSPPIYTGRAVHRFDGMIGEMEAFEGSAMEIQLEFNKPVESATLVWTVRDQRPATETELFDTMFDNVTGEEVLELDPNAPLSPEREALASRIEADLAPDRRTAVINLKADVGGAFEFEVVDQFELRNLPEPERRISVLYDQPPEVKISGIRDGDRYRPDDIIPVNALAIDDIGVGDVELHYHVNDEVSKIISAADHDRGDLEVRHEFRLRLEDIDVVAGDVLTMRVRATDERPEPGPQIALSERITITIDDNAKPPGARAMEEENREMIQALRKLEQQLEKDAERATALKEDARRNWSDGARDSTRQLSEKEQQQGRVLEQLANDVATHPMMKDSAEKLAELSEQIRDDLPEMLDEAADQDRRNAAATLERTAERIDEIRRELHDEISKIDEVAKLEADLGELNRLALQAEQLAEDAEQLELDRKQPENKPEDVPKQDWDEQLNQRQQELSQEREALSEGIERLLDEERELLKAAQRAQTEKLDELADAARELARQQERVAEGVQDEAREVGREARRIANDLDQIQRDGEKLNQELNDRANADAGDEQIDQPDLNSVGQAADELREGNLANPQQDVENAAQEFERLEQQLREDAAEENNERQAQAEKDANELAERLKQAGEQIEKLRQDRGVNQPPADSNSGEAAQNQNAGQQEPQGEQEPGEAAEQGIQDEKLIDGVLDRLDELAEAANEISNALDENQNASKAAQQNAEDAAENARTGSEEASAGQFAKSAQELREAGKSAKKSAAQMDRTDGEQQDRQQQLNALGGEFERMAEQLENLQMDNSSQSAAQQQTQQGIAQEASELPQQLAEVAERMGLESLEMAQQSQQARQAQQMAQQAQQSSESAASELQQGQLERAGASGEQAAEELNQLADIAQGRSEQPGQQAGNEPGEQPGQQPGNEPSAVPTEVGESVAEALQNLQQAAEAMQQQSQEQSEGQPGESSEQSGQGQQGEGQQGDQSASAEGQQGQPGAGQQQGEGQQGEGQQGQGQQSEGQGGKPGQSGSKPLSSAAQSLAQAAKDALPGQFSPDQPPEGEGSSRAGRDAMGNASMWDGLSPDDGSGPPGSRNWGQQHEELDSETSDGATSSYDSEYQALIRMYFREVAKATSRESDD